MIAANELVVVQGDRATTTSRIVAAHFGKRHKNVLQAIESLIQQVADNEFARLNFQPSEYVDSTGRTLPEYTLSEQGFSLLAMGFTGQKATAFKVSFIQAFEKAVKRIRELETRQASPAWQAVRHETKAGYRDMGWILQAVREGKGKSTERHHYINEARLLNHALTGDSKTSIHRDLLSREALRVLADLERLNAKLLIQGEDFQLRKARCRLFAVEQLQRVGLLGVSA